jgi:hypothetical protein
MVGARDQFGLPVSTGSEVAALWDGVVDDLLNYGSGVEAGLRPLIEADPGFALGHALLGWEAVTGSADADPEAELALAEQLVAGASERERAFVAGVRATVADPFARPEPWGAYLTSYPSDLLARLDHAFAVRFGFRADHVDVVSGLWEEARQVNGDHPLVLASRGFLAQETGDLDLAESLAQDAFDVRSDSVPGAHVQSHVHFERGRHATGLSWLTSWCRDRMPTGSDFAPHLSWHAGLHELALDDREAVLARLGDLAGPDSSEGWLLSNGASYLWRLRLAGLVEAGDDPSGGAIGERCRELAAAPGSVFLGWHLAIGLGCDGDLTTLRRLAAGGLDASAPGVAEVVPAVAGAVADLLEGEPARAADALTAIRPEAYRLGGSRAQREVLEDTLLAALVQAARTTEAAQVLTERLDRRPLADDSRRLAALTVPMQRQTRLTQTSSGLP